MQLIAVIAAVIIASLLFVAAADAGPMLVNVAEIVLVEVFAAVGDIDIPVAIIDEDADALMGEIPANIVIISLGLGCFYRQGQVAAAQARTIFTKYFRQNKLLISIFKNIQKPSMPIVVAIISTGKVGVKIVCHRSFLTGLRVE